MRLSWCWIIMVVLMLCAGPAFAWVTPEFESVWKEGQKTSETLKPGEVWTDPVTGMEFVWVPGGCYMMGQTESEMQYLIDEVGQHQYENYHSNARPRHKVCVNGFWMGKYEVTRGQFQKFIKTEGYRTDAEKAGMATIWKNVGNPENKPGYSWRKTGFSQTDRHPVVCVSWNDAKAFAEWLSERTGKEIRLPTEAEWEYAARGGTETMRFWGDDESGACRYANVADKSSNWRPSFPCDDGYKFTAPVGSFKPNPFGLYDMLGNVWEWCKDVYDQDAYSKHLRENPLITHSIYTHGNIRLESYDGTSRVNRGGGWIDLSSWVRSAFRFGPSLHNADTALGFRLCTSRVR